MNRTAGEVTEKATRRLTPLVLLAALCLLPAMQTLVSIYWQWHGAITYPALKGLMILLPLVIWFHSGAGRSDILSAAGWKKTNFRPGLVIGALMGAVILCGYYVVLRSLIDPVPVAAKLRAMGMIDHYWLMAAGICLWNSLFEEYYWRAFLLGELRLRVRGAAGVCILCGVLFSLHHIFALAAGFAWPMVVLASAATGFAGAAWTWMRVRGYSIFDCYVSHIIADAAIMWIGYDLVLMTR